MTKSNLGYAALKTDREGTSNGVFAIEAYAACTLHAGTPLAVLYLK